MHASLGVEAKVSEVKPEKPEDFGYGCIIDAGSSGSRIYVYKWPIRSFSSLPIPLTQVYQTALFVEKVRPGLSSFLNNPEGAGPVIEKLLADAKPHIPKGISLSTVPVYLGATAGMRVLDPKAAEKIFEAIRNTLRSSKFLFRDEWARIISGEEEGTYSWIAANYLKGAFEQGAQKTTYGALDLGGASTQITFIPEESILANMFPIRMSEHVNYQVYTHSYLYYGVNEAIARFNNLLLKETGGSRFVDNPCYPKGYNKGGFNGTSDWDSCLRKTSDLFDFKSQCFQSDGEQQRCSFNGVYQPAIGNKKKFIAMSAFFYTWSFLKLKTGADSDNLNTLVNTAQVVCKKTFEEQKQSNPSFNQQNQCFNVAYVYHLLHEGYHMDAEDTPLEVYTSVNGAEVTWALGAIMLEVNFLGFKFQNGKLYEILFYALFGVICIGVAIALAFRFRKKNSRRRTSLDETLLSEDVSLSNNSDIL